MSKVRILGLSATPIKDGNCDTVVQESLKSAKELESPELGEVETRFITLSDKKIAPCDHCQWCIENRAPCKIQDDVHAIYDEMKNCDGLIIGTPAYLNNISPFFPIFVSRIRYYAFFTHDFRNKIVGIISLGFFGIGLERCVDTTSNITDLLQMIPVAEASVTTSTRVFGQRPAYLEHGALDDSWGMSRVRMLGPRVVEIARMVKFATEHGVVMPKEYKRTYVGAKLKPLEAMAFVDGVWRTKTE